MRFSDLGRLSTCRTCRLNCRNSRATTYELEPRWGEVDLRVAPSRGSEARLLDSGSGGTMMGPDDDDQGVLLGLTKAKLAGQSRPQQISPKGLQPVR